MGTKMLLFFFVGSAADVWPQQAATLTLKDSVVTAAIDSSAVSPFFGELTSLRGEVGDTSNLISDHGGVPVWSAEFVVGSGAPPVKVDSRSVIGAKRSATATTSSSALLHWDNCVIAHGLEAAVTVELQLVQGQLEYRLSVSAASARIGLWSWAVTPVGALALPKGSSLFENAGFGLVHTPPAQFSGVYPQHTMQYMAAYGLGDGGTSGVYVAAHDPTAESKNFAFVPTPHPLTKSISTGAFTVSGTPPAAGLALKTNGFAARWPVVVRVFKGDWWDASQIYRSWVLAHATWTKQGPMRTRTDIPSWLYNITTWVNSHWQQNDIFNVSGGDPAVTANRVAAIVDRFGIGKDSLALHWYEWDTLGYKEGSNYTECATEETCGFDTHYPEYFPVREGFEAALATMQALGVRVAPYINGRIFDKGTKSWVADDNAAQVSAAKQAAPSLGGTNVSFYDESYGSKAKFAVMCPHTAYWQKTIAEVVDKLTNGYATDGVYIDQIAAAGPRPCWDKTHGHALGGGDHWVTGYAEMLRQARAAAGGTKILLTESNSEPFMGGINLFLTLVGFSTGDLPGGLGPTIMVPAFQGVYGGYVLPVGAEFFRDDFLPDPNVFAAKIAAQYVFGAQLGWFSLGGRDNQHPAMGIIDLLLDSDYDDEVFYLRSLSNAKQIAAPWFNHGRMMRPIELKLNASTTSDGSALPVSIANHPRQSQRTHDHLQHDDESHLELGSGFSLGFGAVMATAWQNPSNSSLLLTFTATKRATPIFSLRASLDLAEYGFGEGSHGKQFDVMEIAVGPDGPSEPWRKVGIFDGATVNLRLVLGVRGVALIRIQAAE